MIDKVYHVSAEIERQRFAKKATRFARALKVLPHSRDLERLPFLASIPAYFEKRQNLHIIDVLCGTGYLAEALQPLGKITLADLTSELLSDVQVRDARKVELDAISLLPRVIHDEFDAIVSLAGLHHVYLYESARHTLLDDSIDLQIDALCSWGGMLRNSGGIMIIADVPHWTPAELSGHQSFGDQSSVRFDLTGAVELQPYFEKALRVIGFREELNSIRTLDQYVNSPHWNALKHARGFTSPENFFYDEVSSTSTVGHDGVFIRPSKLCQALQERGFDVVGTQIPTPWIFKSEREAAWFFTELFSIGEEHQRSADMSATMSQQFVRSKLSRMLGVTNLRSGGIAIWWQLYYTFIGKKT